MTKLSIHVRNVSKTFKTRAEAVHALRDVNFDARLGELLMIVGPSGCGKTTLLSVIAGTLAFDSGEIDVLDRSINNMNEDELCAFRRKNIGFIFQQYHLIPTLSICENVSIPLILNGVSRETSEKKSNDLLAQLGLEGRGRDRPKMLSGGQQQRVAIARALIHDPTILICDEPTSALDAATGEQILGLLAEIAHHPNRTVIVVTHDNRIFKFADRVAEMDDGTVMGILDQNGQGGG